MEPENKDEITLYKIWTMIWYRLPIIVLIGLIAFVISIAVFFVKPEAHSLYASVKIDNIPSSKYYSNQELIYFMKDDKILNNFIDENHKLNSIRKALDISVNGNTGYIEFRIKKTSEADYWFNVIEEIVSLVNYDVDAKYTEEANKKLERISNDIKEIEKNLITEENINLYNNLILQKSKLENQIEDFESCMKFITSPQKVEQVSRGLISTSIIGAFLGCVIGGICTLIAGFTDDKIRMSYDLNHISKNGKLILSIPECKNSDSFDSRYSKYIASFIDDSDKNILISSISSNVGVSTITNDLKNIYENKEKEVVKADSFKNDPSVLNMAKAADKVIIILRNNIDSITELKNMDKSLTEIGCKNINYVLNFVSRSDSEAIKYLSDKDYVGSKYRFW